MKKILVVDDNKDILELILMILGLENFETTGLDNGSDVFDKIDTFKPDLVVLDVLLGDADGRDLCHQIKSNPKTSTVIVVMISASHAAFSLPETYCKPDDFIAKPFDIEDLVVRIKRLLN